MEQTKPSQSCLSIARFRSLLLRLNSSEWTFRIVSLYFLISVSSLSGIILSSSLCITMTSLVFVLCLVYFPPISISIPSYSYFSCASLSTPYYCYFYSSLHLVPPQYSLLLLLFIASSHLRLSSLIVTWPWTDISLHLTLYDTIHHRCCTTHFSCSLFCTLSRYTTQYWLYF